jgi:hypothetical protein
MDPHRLDVGTQGARQLADDPGVPAGVRQRVERVGIDEHRARERGVGDLGARRDAAASAEKILMPAESTPATIGKSGRTRKPMITTKCVCAVMLTETPSWSPDSGDTGPLGKPGLQ